MMQVDDLSSIDPNVDYTQLMEFEYKLQKVEASLLILESQLSSISGLDNEESTAQTQRAHDETDKSEAVPDLPEVQEVTVKTENPVTIESSKEVSRNEGPVASEDSRFQRFFKMVQFGVPPPAVKLKMRAEGVDPDILDTPYAIIPSFSSLTGQTTSDSSNSS